MAFGGHELIIGGFSGMVWRERSIVTNKTVFNKDSSKQHDCKRKDGSEKSVTKKQNVNMAQKSMREKTPTKPKRIFFCVDFEEWFHIPYLEKYQLPKTEGPRFSSMLGPFAEEMKQRGIPLNFFVVGDIAEKNASLLRSFQTMGHSINCHSMHHLACNQMSLEDFKKDTIEAKTAIEAAIGTSVKGYRAPFFSLVTEQFEILEELGFSFDSSFIDSSANEYYSHLDMSSFVDEGDGVYSRNGFREYEIPTLKHKPIAGGGFFRLYPFFVYKRMVKKYLHTHSNFVFFVHPYEIMGDVPFPQLKKLGLKDRIRFQIGRKTVISKIEKMIEFFRGMGFEFDLFR